MSEPHARTRLAMRVLLAVFYLMAGVVHLVSPDAFLPIMPDWVPMKREVVLVTGLCELAGAAGLFVPGLMRLAGLMLALYAVCVFPANIKHALDGVDVPGLPSSWWYHGPRFVLQPILVWMALFSTGLTRWPLRRR